MNTPLKNFRSQAARPHAPHCRGGASSVLRVSSAMSNTSVFGALDTGLSLQRTPAVPLSTQRADVRLWPSATFGGRALWQDTCVAFD